MLKNILLIVLLTLSIIAAGHYGQKKTEAARCDQYPDLFICAEGGAR